MAQGSATIIYHFCGGKELQQFFFVSCAKDGKVLGVESWHGNTSSLTFVDFNLFPLPPRPPPRLKRSISLLLKFSPGALLISFHNLCDQVHWYIQSRLTLLFHGRGVYFRGEILTAQLLLQRYLSRKIITCIVTYREWSQLFILLEKRESDWRGREGNNPWPGGYVHG